MFFFSYAHGDTEKVHNKTNKNKLLLWAVLHTKGLKREARK